MKNLISLLKLYALNNLGLNKMIYSKNKNGKGKLVSGILLFAFIGVSMIFSVSVYAILFGFSLAQIDAVYLMPVIFMLLSSIMILITNIFSVKGILFAFKDYDLQMSLPFSEKTIVTSRMIILYLTNFLFAFVLMVPPMIIYGFFAPTNFLFYVTYIIGIFLTPALPILIGSAFGLIITVATAKMKLKNIVKIILQVCFFAGIMVFSFSLSSLSALENSDAFIGNAISGLMIKIGGFYPFADMFGSALKGDIAQFLLLIAINVLFFIVFILITAKIFKKINSLMNASSARGDFKSKYISKDMKIKSPLKALTIKELKRYSSSSIYVINTFMGMIMLALATGYILFAVDGEMINILNSSGFESLILNAIPIALSFFIFMGSTTPYAISMEGKNFWILKTLPIKSELIFKSKLYVNLIVNVPLSIICGIIICIKFGADPLTYIFSIIVPILSAILTGLLGLLINLKFPKMEWQNEATVVKQSAAGFISVFGGMIFGIALFIGVFALSFLPSYLIYIFYSIVISLISYGIWYYIKSKGDKIIMEL